MAALPLMWQAVTDYPTFRQSKHVYVGKVRVASRLNISGTVDVGYEESNTYYYHPDHVGSAQLVTDPSGEEYERIEYTPYGEIWVEKVTASVEKIPFRFTGKELDEETGLYYYGARYLDPKTSSWLSADPALGDYIPVAPVDEEARKKNGNLPGMGGVYNLVNLHLYHYAGNNPVKYTDPDGNELIVADGLGLAFGDPYGGWDVNSTYLFQRSPFDKTWIASALNFLGLRDNSAKPVGRLEFDKKGEYCDKEPGVGWDRIRIKDIKTGADKGGFWAAAKKDGKVEIGFKGLLFGVSFAGDVSKAKVAQKTLEGGGSALAAIGSMHPSLGNAATNAATGTENNTIAGFLLSFIPGYGTVTGFNDFADGIMQGEFIRNEQLLEGVK